MLKWRTVNFIILGTLVAGASLFAAKTPGWNSALAQVGYYKYAATTFHRQGLSPNQWVNGPTNLSNVNQYAIFIPVDKLANIAAQMYCTGKWKAQVSSVTPSDNTYSTVNVACSNAPSTPETLTKIPYQQQQGKFQTYLVQWRDTHNTNWGPYAIDEPLYMLTAKTYCENNGQILNPKHGTKLRSFMVHYKDVPPHMAYYLDVGCVFP